jgi:hypothetical protein
MRQRRGVLSGRDAPQTRQARTLAAEAGVKKREGYRPPAEAHPHDA